VGPHQAENPRQLVWVFAFREKPKLALGFEREAKSSFAAAKRGFLFAGAVYLWSIRTANEPKWDHK
jgi:hypothetical protein